MLGDGETVNRGGDDHVKTCGGIIARDGDGPVIDRELELRLHVRGQRQQRRRQQAGLKQVGFHDFAVLGRAETVEAGGIIGPLRVAEIRRAADEIVRAHRKPDWIGKIGAGFHHDGLASGCPGDGEAELV